MLAVSVTVPAPPGDPFEGLLRSLAAFYQALEEIGHGNANQFARLAMLKVLIERFPEESRRILASIDARQKDTRPPNQHEA